MKSYILHSPTSEDGTDSEFRTQTPGNYPKRNTLHLLWCCEWPIKIVMMMMMIMEMIMIKLIIGNSNKTRLHCVLINLIH